MGLVAPSTSQKFAQLLIWVTIWMVTPRQIPQPNEKDSPPHTISHQEFPSEGGIPTPRTPLPLNVIWETLLGV